MAPNVNADNFNMIEVCYLCMTVNLSIIQHLHRCTSPEDSLKHPPSHPSFIVKKHAPPLLRSDSAWSDVHCPSGLCTCNDWMVSSPSGISHLQVDSFALKRKSIPLNLKPYSFSTVEYKESPESVERTSNTACAVCLSEFEDLERVRQLPQCRHSFHGPCIDVWLYAHSDCPLCRTPIDQLDPGKVREDNYKESCSIQVVYN